MDLNYKTFGRGEPLIILHGLFGMLDNWQTLAKKFAAHFTVFIIDQRNHGRSPHTDAMSYPLMAQDLYDFMSAHWIHRAHILGHSMGGKTAMQLALDYPEVVDKLVVVDIGPWQNEPGHELIFEALQALPLDQLQSRREAELQLADRISDAGIRRFLLKNMTRNKEGGYRWKMNLPAITKHYAEILSAVKADQPYKGPALFIKGEESEYIRQEDEAKIQRWFSAAQLWSIAGAGHWIHTDEPEALSEAVLDFLLAPES